MDLSRCTGGPIPHAAAPEMARQGPATLAVVVARAAVALPQATHVLIGSDALVLPAPRALVFQSWGTAAEGPLALTPVLAPLAATAIGRAVAAPRAQAPPLGLAPVRSSPARMAA